jgi:hypothetical protein
MCFRDTLVEVCGTTLHHIPEDITLHSHRCEKIVVFFNCIRLASPTFTASKLILKHWQTSGESQGLLNNGQQKVQIFSHALRGI